MILAYSNMGLTKTQKAFVISFGSRDWKHLRISLARNEALAAI